jgi:hypothetical protein
MNKISQEILRDVQDQIEKGRTIYYERFNLEEIRTINKWKDPGRWTG